MMKQWMTTSKAATRIHLGERRSRLPMEGRFTIGALMIAFITLLTSGSIHAQGRNEALSIDQQGNVGVGTSEPQAFQVELPESAKPTAPKPGVTLSGGADGNANIELRNNGSGTPYIDFAQKSGVDYDARIILTEPGKLAIKGATLTAKSFETDAGISLATLQNALNMLVPIGTIMAYGGDTTNADIVSQLAAQGWLPCDGRAVSKTTYADLFRVIGNSFGAEGRLDIWGSTAAGPMIINRVFTVTNPDGFRVPDLRGRFLRGTDQGQQRDPDAALRQDLAGGGHDGDRVGSVQEDQFRSHKHTFDAWHGGGIDGASQADPPAMAGWIKGPPNTKAVQETGGAETRPKNINVNWIIKATHLIPRAP